MGNCANDCAKTYCNKDGAETGEVKIEVSIVLINCNVDAVINIDTALNTRSHSIYY
jgi:hypothetical protein